MTDHNIGKQMEGPTMMTPMPAVPDETTKAFTYSTPAVEAPTSASPLDKWRDLSDRVQGMTISPHSVKVGWSLIPHFQVETKLQPT